MGSEQIFPKNILAQYVGRYVNIKSTVLAINYIIALPGGQQVIVARP